jgi:molybdate transport system substrate-binding protein
MRMSSLAAAAKIGCLILLMQGVANAAEIKVISATAFTAATNELRAQFERTTGHKLVMKSVSGPVVKREVDAGETFDVAITQPTAIDDLVKAGKIVDGTRADIARAGVGVGVRAGAAKPDISSVEGFKQALLNAKAVTHSREGASGVYFASLLERLGITEEMKPKLRPMGAGASVEPVVKGEADLVVVTIPLLLVPGIDIVGALPAELQNYIGFSAGISAAAKEPEAARALVKFLTSEEAGPLIKAKGMEPLTR